MKKLNSKGFSLVEVLLLLVIVGIIGGVGYYVYNNQKDDVTVSDSTVASEPAANEATTAETTTKPDPNAGYLVLKQWGLRFKTPSGLTDVRYAINGDTVGFFAKPTGSKVQYRSDYDKFEDGYFRYATGILTRSTDNTSSPDVKDGSVQGKKVGSYYYYTYWSFSSTATGAACVGLYGDAESNCEPEGVAFGLVNQADKALLKTIELAQ